MATRRSTTYGFTRTSGLLQEQIRKASETRGFAQSRVLTHWAEIVGDDFAGVSRPVDVSYGRGGFGATLTVLTTGANAPMLEMQKEQLRGKINAVYGYNAITRVRITQTSATGFSEGRASFQHRPGAAQTAPNPAAVAEAKAASDGVQSEELKAALERLTLNFISKKKG
ncbi:DUF721 domain-containing protein [Pseudoprimorskyibacter insulae]|uniref:RNA-binding protein n=1 Tax=Pseudoprimorskyibacter insulae TaxID=1695997 RepID=A0A2R8AUL4_9RHOB|nr:DUF721 domain-containing protein [Pseudoprimorskyibacter insulae]SPF79721.1 hypothetical protein PRI8871_01518 [Pseudoprimorskyibacter insulae]